MVRVLIKGGSWKNSEDEVLKAAIAKYGKNQWARISSLLVRKTPKQCKARWYEWLDPSIKKTEWSKTEDEKLLHLAKLMPTQWRTIAPIVGRTATQCLERYQKLLDEAEAKEAQDLGLAGPEGPEGQPSADDIRRLRPGEIDPDPETKPARPDPIDMDEDEKEMLSEARARLANTQGKKAKRKARERQLEEARRLAVLQKKRELKAAGIIMRSKPKRKGMDYNADIPFEKQPAPGFYDVSEENAKAQSAPIGQTLRRLDNKRKGDDDGSEAKKRAKKAQEAKEGPQPVKFNPAREAQIQKLKEAEEIGKRRKLMLPTAQVGETELEEIVKIGQAGENARSLLKDSNGEGSEASAQLFGEYEGLEHARTTRTPRTAAQEDNVMAEALALRDRTQLQTPLLGDENTPLHDPRPGATGFESATPRHQMPFTPNPLATPLRVGGKFDPSATPKGPDGAPVSGTPFRTPMRDSLNLNALDGASSIGDTPREVRMHANSAKRALQSGFASLPKPKNDFELDIDGMGPNVEEDEDEATPMSEEDAAERDARAKRAKEEAERKTLARRTVVVQRALPRPVNVDVTLLLANLESVVEEEAALREARHLVNRELAAIIEHDTIAYPLPGTKYPGGTESSYEMPHDEDVALAKALLHAELAQAVGFPGASDEQVRQGIMLFAKEEFGIDGVDWASKRKSLVFNSATREWVEPTSLSDDSILQGMAAILERDRERMVEDAAKAVKAEKKLGKILGGYQVRFDTLAKRLAEAFEQLNKNNFDLESFSSLSITESAAIPRRLQGLSEEVETLERRERSLQERYKDLDTIRRELQSCIAMHEDRIMAEAEALNEQALEDMEDEA